MTLTSFRPPAAPVCLRAGAAGGVAVLGFVLFLILSNISSRGGYLGYRQNLAQWIERGSLS